MIITQPMTSFFTSHLQLVLVGDGIVVILQRRLQLLDGVELLQGVQDLALVLSLLQREIEIRHLVTYQHLHATALSAPSKIIHNPGKLCEIKS